MANTTYEEVITKLELARRLSLGATYTSPKEKEISINDKLIVKALKEKYQDVKDVEAWSKFGAKVIIVANKQLGIVNDKIAGKIPPTVLETTQSLQTWKTELEGILSDGSQDALRKLTTLATAGDIEVNIIPPDVLKENERDELIRLRKENYELMKVITEMPERRTPSKDNTSSSSTSTSTGTDTPATKIIDLDDTERERERANQTRPSSSEKETGTNVLGDPLGDPGEIKETDPGVRDQVGELRDRFGNIIEEPKPPKPKSRKELRKEKKNK